MISEGSCDTEDLSNRYWKFSLAFTGINYILKYNATKCNNILLYFYQINPGFVSIRDFFHKLLYGSVWCIRTFDTGFTWDTLLGFSSGALLSSSLRRSRSSISCCRARCFSPVPPAYAGAPGIHVLPPLFAPVPSVHALPGLKHKTKHQFKNEKKLAKVHTLNKYEYCF